MKKSQNLIKSFVSSEFFGGILLFISTILALLLSNSFWAEQYENFWKINLGITIHQFFIGFSLENWINDVLMSFFFLMVGLEIKKEFLVGELSNFKNALFPVFAAIGGMIIPGLIYYGLNFHTPSYHGFGIPMATDIAFALGVVLLLGKKVPPSLKIFLVTLAVVDDLGAILVIGLFYTQEIHWIFLILACAIILLLMLCNYLSVSSLWIYIPMGAILWLLIHESGIHATISAVILAFCIPLRVAKKSYQQSQKIQTPLEKLEHFLQPYCIYLIMPLFAFANAGVRFSEKLDFGIDHIFLGIFLGLLVGKPIGIFGICFICDCLGIAKKPSQVSWAHIFGAGMLAGIGFTMSIFVTHLAFSHIDSREIAKATVLFSSLLAAIFGAFALFLINKISK